MITRSSTAFEDFLGSSIAPQVMPPWTLLPDPNPTRYPVFCPIPDPTRYWKTLPAGHCSPAISWPHLGILNNFPNFFEWIILLNILESIEWLFFWMNIPDFVLNWILNWIIFRPDSMKKWIFKKRSPNPTPDFKYVWLCMVGGHGSLLFPSYSSSKWDDRLKVGYVTKINTVPKTLWK